MDKILKRLDEKTWHSLLQSSGKGATSFITKVAPNTDYNPYLVFKVYATLGKDIVGEFNATIRKYYTELSDDPEVYQNISYEARGEDYYSDGELYNIGVCDNEDIEDWENMKVLNTSMTIKELRTYLKDKDYFYVWRTEDVIAYKESLPLSMLRKPSLLDYKFVEFVSGGKVEIDDNKRDVSDLIIKRAPSNWLYVEEVNKEERK